MHHPILVHKRIKKEEFAYINESSYSLPSVYVNLIDGSDLAPISIAFSCGCRLCVAKALIPINEKDKLI